jgi:dihydrofolate reductase
MINMIVAVNPQGIIAIDGKIPWNKPEDLKRFKKITMGGTLIMGRNTWDSIGRKLLPGRRTLVLSRALHSTHSNLDGVMTASSINEALLLSRNLDWDNGGWRKIDDNQQVWIVGGAQIYEQFMLFIKTIDVTVVNDCNFPERQQEYQPNIIKLKSFVDNFPGFKKANLKYKLEDPTLENRMYYKEGFYNDQYK